MNVGSRSEGGGKGKGVVLGWVGWTGVSSSSVESLMGIYTVLQLSLSITVNYLLVVVALHCVTSPHNV